MQGVPATVTIEYACAARKKMILGQEKNGIFQKLAQFVYVPRPRNLANPLA